jgi:hypothetical protein
VSVECVLPGAQLFLGKGVSLASFLQRDGAAAQGRENRGLAARHPSLGVRRWQITH